MVIIIQYYGILRVWFPGTTQIISKKEVWLVFQGNNEGRSSRLKQTRELGDKKLTFKFVWPKVIVFILSVSARKSEQHVNPMISVKIWLRIVCMTQAHEDHKKSILLFTSIYGASCISVHACNWPITSKQNTACCYGCSFHLCFRLMGYIVVGYGRYRIPVPIQLVAMPLSH